MTDLRATGLGSGLDIQGIVEQLVAAERQPVANRLNLQEARANAELSALGKLKSALASFQDSLANLSDIDKFQQRAATVGDDTRISVTADQRAQPGSFDVEVLSLASAQKLGSQAFASADAVVGSGTLAITVGGNTALITLTEGANTLAGLRDAINASPDNPGVRANIVNADDGAYLVISAEKTGLEGAITIDALDPPAPPPPPSGNQGQGQGNQAPPPEPPPNPLEAFEFGAGTSNSMTELQAAADAVAKVDGFAVTSAGNVLEDVIDGVTVNLLDVTADGPVGVSIRFDQDASNAAVGAFVNAYNELGSVIAEVTRFNPETAEAAALLGDAAVRGIKDQLRRELGNAVDVPGADFRTLADIGIATQPDGRLELDATKLSNALSANFDGVGDLFAGTTGVAVRLESILETALGGAGALQTKEDGLKDRLELIGDRRTTLDERIERVRERLLRQFNAMDRLLSSLQNTSSFLTRQLGA